MGKTEATISRREKWREEVKFKVEAMYTWFPFILELIYFYRNGDTILFTHEGGVDVGDVDAKALKLDIGIDEFPSISNIKTKLLVNVNEVSQILG